MANSITKNQQKQRKKTVRVPGSAAAQLEALAIGRSLAEGSRLELDKGTPVAAQQWLDSTVRHWSVIVSRVKRSKVGSDYTVERMTDFSHGGALLCAVVITRIA